MKKCLISNDECIGPIDKEHTKTKGSGGPDCFKTNLVYLCRFHHQMKGNKGVNYMAEKYPVYKKKLIELGWEWEEFRGKWVNYNLYKEVIK